MSYDIGDGTLWAYCREHACPAQIYSDGSERCWWELVVETSHTHDSNDIVPVKLVQP